MRVIFYLLLIVFLFSCEEQFGLGNDETPQNIIDSSLEMFEGDILEKSIERIDGIDVWKVRLENESGAVISFYWQKNYGILYGIEGEKGPFDYEIKPPLSIIVLSTARFLAFESYSSEVLDSWRLIRDKSNDEQWVYLFFLAGREKPITMDAKSGDLM
ncbi:MAG: hypothetical protein MI975_18740 [Cytophagales bacterium]|nr:hypothetical protein [Cytophagales bacterium]